MLYQMEEQPICIFRRQAVESVHSSRAGVIVKKHYPVVRIKNMQGSPVERYPYPARLSRAGNNDSKGLKFVCGRWNHIFFVPKKIVSGVRTAEDCRYTTR